MLLCWLSLLLIRIAETQAGDTWRNLRDELQRLHLGTFTGPTGISRQRTSSPLANSRSSPRSASSSHRSSSRSHHPPRPRQPTPPEPSLPRAHPGRIDTRRTPVRPRIVSIYGRFRHPAVNRAAGPGFKRKQLSAGPWSSLLTILKRQPLRDPPSRLKRSLVLHIFPGCGPASFVRPQLLRSRLRCRHRNGPPSHDSQRRDGSSHVPISARSLPEFPGAALFAHPVAIMANLVSMLETGVFERFPDLRVGVMEAGVSWVPFLMYRLDKHFMSLRRQMPHLRELPSAAYAAIVSVQGVRRLGRGE